MNLIQHFVNGKIIPGKSNRKGKVFNPAVGEQESEVILGLKSDLDDAVDVAKKAFETWSLKPPMQRARIMFKFKELIEKNSDELTKMIVLEHGKVYEDAKGSLIRGLEVVEFTCGIPQVLKGEFTENVGTDIDSWSIRQPLGVCAGITPFNFPAMVPMWMFPIAIVCGNSFILKPSEKDPSCAMKLAELMQKAGLPKGVMNVLHGDKEIVDAILEHRSIKTFSFVGSTPVAKYVNTKASEQGKRVQALGGAKNHAIVLADADIEQTANSIIGAAYGSAGERCMAISAVVAVEKIADPLRDSLLKKAQQLKIGPGQMSKNDMGPLITAEHKQKVMSYIQEGKDSGADLLLDGRDHPVTSDSEGFFLGPTLFDNVQNDMSIYLDEIFGPVLVMLRVKNLSEAIDLANEHQFGNGVALFTSNGSAAREFVSSVQVGMVGINVAIPVPLSFYTFGGWKDSIYGSSNIYGMEGVRFYTRTKTVTTRWPDMNEDQDLNLAMPTVE